MVGSKQNENDTPEQGQSEKIGQRLRVLRAERGMTISDLADAAGISSGLISQIESGNSNPSMKTIEKLRLALGVNVWEFTDMTQSRLIADPSFVRRADSRPKIVVGTNGFSKELLSPQTNHSMRFMILTLPTGARSEDVLSGPGNKGGYVLEGNALLTVGDETAELAPGDSFQFSSSLSHDISNKGTQTARVLWIIGIHDSHF